MSILDKLMDDAEQDAVLAESSDLPVENVLPSLERVMVAWDDPKGLYRRLVNTVTALMLAAKYAGDRSGLNVAAGALMAAGERDSTPNAPLTDQLAAAAAAAELASDFPGQRDAITQYASVIGQRLAELTRESAAA